MTLFQWVMVIAGVVGALWLLNSEAVRNIFRVLRAKFGQAGAAAVRADPKAMWDQELRDNKQELNGSIDGLEESKALTEELREQVERDTRAVVLLNTKIENSLKDDPDDNNGRAAEYIVQLEDAKKRQETNTKQYENAQTLYSNSIKRFKFATKKMQEIERRGSMTAQEMKNSETNARLATLAKNFNVNVGSLDSKLNEAEDEMRRKIARNNAVSQVQTDLGINGLAEAEEEERLAKANAKSKLDEYRKKMGLNTEKVS